MGSAFVGTGQNNGLLATSLLSRPSERLGEVGFVADDTIASDLEGFEAVPLMLDFFFRVA